MKVWRAYFKQGFWLGFGGVIGGSIAYFFVQPILNAITWIVSGMLRIFQVMALLGV